MVGGRQAAANPSLPCTTGALCSGEPGRAGVDGTCTVTSMTGYQLHFYDDTDLFDDTLTERTYTACDYSLAGELGLDSHAEAAAVVQAHLRTHHLALAPLVRFELGGVCVHAHTSTRHAMESFAAAVEALVAARCPIRTTVGSVATPEPRRDRRW
jgi:hypothetical protein